MSFDLGRASLALFRGAASAVARVDGETASDLCASLFFL